MQQEGARDMARDWWPGSYGRRVSRCYGCDFRGIAEIVPSPDNVEIGAQQNQVKAVYVSGRMIRDFNCIHGGAVYRHRRIELRYVDLAVAGFQDGKSFGGNQILHCGSVVEPHVWKPRSRPRCRFIGAEQMLWAAWNVADDGRIYISVVAGFRLYGSRSYKTISDEQWRSTPAFFEVGTPHRLFDK